jgi:P4 family phage/plasmid primase-like protien
VDFEDFLEKVVPNPTLRAYVKRFLSKCISGENRDEGFYIWTGSGGNGKSKLINLMCACLGEYACNLPVALLTQKRKSSGAADPEMARTRGKRFVYMQEPDVNETLNVGEMKEITGNDTIQARCLFKEPFEFVPQFKLILMCNDLPKIPSNDDGTWRRLQATPFVSRFVDEAYEINPEEHCYPKDKQLKEKLPLWVLPMYHMLFQEWGVYNTDGIDVPDIVKERTTEYRNENDIVGRWITDCCEVMGNVVDTDGVTEYAPSTLGILHDGFKEWCVNQEIAKFLLPDKSKFRKALVKWQKESTYGFKCAKKKTEAKPNGTEREPRFNLVPTY